jgi:CarD family transcriptional regulator
VEYLYGIGDHIIYPMHGVGRIEGIEEKIVQGHAHKYFVIKIATNNMQVLIPFENIDSSQIRPVADNLSMENVLDIYHHGESDRSLSWKQRFNINSGKLKSGKLQESAEVVRDLSRMQTEKNLNSSEKKMLDNAKKVLVSEIGIVKGITELQANNLLRMGL